MIKKIDISKNAHEAIMANKKKTTLNIRVIVDNALIKAGLMNKDGSVKE